MTLPQAAAPRQLKHRRPIDVQLSCHGDGLQELGALLQALKARGAPTKIEQIHRCCTPRSVCQIERVHTSRHRSRTPQPAAATTLSRLTPRARNPR